MCPVGTDTAPAEFTFEFFLRHVDDQPTIADSRFLNEAAGKIRETALGFAVLGEIDGATKLLETLYNHGIDPFRDTDFDYPFLRPCMYFAWDVTSAWPAWIPGKERSEDRLKELEAQGRGPWLERFSEEWDVTDEIAMNATELGSQGIPSKLPDFNGTLAGQVFQVQTMWKNGEFPFAASPNGPMSVRYSQYAMWWRHGIYPYPYVQVFRTAGLMVTLDVWLRLGRLDKAQPVFERICERIYMHEQLEQLACSRAAWNVYLAAPERPLLEMVGVHAAKLRPAVNRAVQMAEKRLDTGPARRYRDYSIEGLARAISKNTFRNCPYGTLAAYCPPDEPRIAAETENGLLCPGCSPREIAALEDRLGVELPTDYKEFLSVTNGMGSMWNEQTMVDYLGRAEDVCWQQVDYVEGNRLPLLRECDPFTHGDEMLEWPDFPSKFKCICLHGKDDQQGVLGSLYLLDREAIQPSIDYFFKTYAERDRAQQEELDNAVREMYGSLEALRDLKYMLVGWCAWEVSLHPYNGVRDLLEKLAEASLRKARPWSQVFEPAFRRMA